jgi:transcription factor E
MLKKFLKEVVALIAGKQAENIVDLLDTKKHVNEFIIARKLNLTINQTRNILYKISDRGLVSSIRKKDKKKGWYTYFWKIETLKSLEFLKDDLLKKMNQLKHQIKSRETKRFYVCERCHIELSEESALLYNFTCNECGSVFVLRDNTKVIKEMKRNLERFKKDSDLVEEEIQKEKEKLEKAKIKEIKKKQKDKKKKILKKRPLKKKRKAKNKAKRKGKKKAKKKKFKQKRVKKKVKKKPSKKKSRTKKPKKRAKRKRRK